MSDPSTPVADRAASDRTTVYVPAVVSPGPPVTVVARDEPDAETRALLRRRLLVIFSILTGAVGVGNLALLMTGVATRLEWWDWLLLVVWGGVVACLAGRWRLSLPTLRACELVGFGALGAVWVWWTILASEATGEVIPRYRQGSRHEFFAS